MMKLLDGRVAVVLGGGSVDEGISIGRAISCAYAREGATVIVGDVNLESAQETAKEIQRDGGAGVARKVDVINVEDLRQLIKWVVDEYRKVDILHCNVGLGKSGPSANTSVEEWRRISDANLTSLHVACQEVLPAMRKARRGVITVTSSIAGIRYVGYPHLAYSTTKAAAIHFAKMVAIENAGCGIRANTIVPGLIDTPRIRTTLKAAYPGSDYQEMRKTRDAQCPLGHMGTPEDIANAALFLASDMAAYITGIELVVDGGLSMSTR